MRVLVTGHRGYIGSVLTGVLRQARFDVVGLDCDFFGGSDFGRTQDDTPGFDVDVRDVEQTDLLSFDAVVHLAAISDDASGAIDPELTDAINVEGTLRLAECCRKANVSRFVLASSCSVYGRGGHGICDERTRPGPVSAYAQSKWLAERVVSRLADHRFSPIFVRLGSVYGVSPKLRMDTVVNDFTASAVSRGRIELRTNGQAWRALVHIEDVARAVTHLLGGPADQIHNQTFNLVAEDGNCRVRDVADWVTEAVAGGTWTADAASFDERSYRVDGGKFRQTFPGFAFRWTLTSGIRQLVLALRRAGLTPGQWRSDCFRRAASLRSQMESGALDDQLRRLEAAVGSG